MTHILIAAQNFHQGSGGVPESARSLASILMKAGVTTDVYDKGEVVRNIGMMPVLPMGRSGEPFPTAQTYTSLIIKGPWQDATQGAWGLRKRIAAQKNGSAFYIPSGGLARIEFSRLQDIKKRIYLTLIERPVVIDGVAGVIYTSELERSATVPAARRPSVEHIIPCTFLPLPYQQPRFEGGRIKFTWLAEISPRKGLLQFVEAFIAWARDRKLQDSVELVVGGAPRPGRDAYLATVKAVASAAPDVDIRFVGAVRHQDRPSFYAGTDIFVMSTFFDSYGLTVPEALCAGCAVVCTPDVGALEFLRSHPALTISENHEAASFALALDKALANAPDSARRDANRLEALATIEDTNEKAVQAWRLLLAV